MPVSTDPSLDNIFDVAGKVVLISGASSGLGAEMARCMVERGAHVILTARRVDRIEEIAADLGSATAIGCDLTDDVQRARLVEEALDFNGRIDVLINSAAAANIQPAEDENVDTFRQIVDVNLVALYGLCHGVGRIMLGHGSGSIINVASIYGIVGSGQIPQASYSASKGAVVNLTRELAAQWARRGVRVNAIAPAYFESELTARMWRNEASLAWMRRNTPMGRAARLREFHGPLVFLASSASSYVTGVTLPVDGGWTAV